MKKALILINCSFLSIALAGCAPIKTIKSVMRPITSFGQAKPVKALPVYIGPKAKIAVADFDVKAPKAGKTVGLWLRETLLEGLAESNRFNIVNPKDASLGPADLIIAAAVTEFEPQASGGKSGMGGGGGVGSGRLGGLMGASRNKARMALELRVLDNAASNVLAVSAVQGQASDVSGALLGSLSLYGGLSGYAGTPMEKAIRICMIEAVRYLSKAVPEDYYKY